MQAIFLKIINNVEFSFHSEIIFQQNTLQRHVFGSFICNHYWSIEETKSKIGKDMIASSNLLEELKFSGSQGGPTTSGSTSIKHKYINYIKNTLLSFLKVAGI